MGWGIVGKTRSKGEKIVSIMENYKYTFLIFLMFSYSILKPMNVYAYKILSSA